MKRNSFFLSAGLALLLLTGQALAAADPDQLAGYVRADGSYPATLTGRTLQASKADRDTLYLLGGPDRDDGKFQGDTQPSLPDPEGWLGSVYWDPPASHWHIDTFNAELLDPVDPNHAMWCGMYFDCGGSPDPGYGNNWDDTLEWYGTVGDPALPTTVDLTARLNHDTEPGYDFLYLEVERATGWEVIQVWDGANKSGGVFVPIDVAETFVVNPADYVGPGGDQIHVRLRFTSDGGWSDEDCQLDTDGAAQVDNIAVATSQGGPSVLLTYDDFQPGSQVNWIPGLVDQPCSFAKVWPLLDDIDPCQDNHTPQFAFIDDGVVCPGTGGTHGILWTYGPDGFVVHDPSPELTLWDEVWSPAIAWPGDPYNGAIFAFDVYRHFPELSGQFYHWHVRFSTDGGVSWGDWQDHNFLYTGGAAYGRHEEDISQFLVPGATHVQLSLGLYVLGMWGWWDPAHLTPAPYYDNVALLAFRQEGPFVFASEMHLAQDAFPANGLLNWVNLQANNVRFDMARNISPPGDLRNDPGDSVVIDAGTVRPGAVLTGVPRMYWKMRANPLYIFPRVIPPNPVLGDTVKTASGEVIPNRWSFDLPDNSFLYPGDVLHYYFRAEDDAGGDVGVTLLPADTTGYSFFPGDGQYRPTQYPHPFVVNALPTLLSDTPGDLPRILLWNDFAYPEGENEWAFALANLGYGEGLDLDVYVTNAAANAVGNGLGGRATPAQIEFYDTILYSSGYLSACTLSNGDYNYDAGNDIALLDSWLEMAGKNLLATGDNLAYDLRNSGPATITFLDSWFSVAFVDQDVRPLIENQTSPQVVPITGNTPGVTTSFHAYGGCPGHNTFDAVVTTGLAERILEFTDPNGLGGVYPYAAGVLNQPPTYGDNIVYLPYGFDFIYTSMGPAVPPPGLAARTLLLDELLTFFGHAGSVPPSAVPEVGQLTVRNYPNPFNPLTKIEYNMPTVGDLTIRVYDVRGQLVRTLLEERVQPGPGCAVWDGTDDGGRAVAAGVYFAETRALGLRKITKMALVK